MKPILALGVTALLASCACSKHLPWIKFDWRGDSLSNRFYDKTAIYIPIQLENMPYKFKAQFDLGAPRTVVYGNTIKPYLEINNNGLKRKLDTNMPYTINGEKCPVLKGVAIKLDNISFGKRDLVFYKDSGDSLTIDSVKTKTVKNIGTIGADLFDDKILIIDFPNQRLCVVNRLPREYASGVNFISMKIKNGRIKIPFTLGGKEQYLLFDTGASIFSLGTTKANLSDVTDKNGLITDSLVGNSWGKPVKFYGKKTTVEIKLGNRILPATTAFYVTDKDFGIFCQQQKIWGITGNVFFLNNTIIIDCKNNKFGIK